MTSPFTAKIKGFSKPEVIERSSGSHGNHYYKYAAIIDADVISPSQPLREALEDHFVKLGEYPANGSTPRSARIKELRFAQSLIDEAKGVAKSE